MLLGHLDGLDGSSGCHRKQVAPKNDQIDRIDHAACRLPQLNLIKFGKKLTALGIESRLSNGEKFWLLVTTQMQPQRATRQSITEVMSDELDD